MPKVLNLVSEKPPFFLHRRPRDTVNTSTGIYSATMSPDPLRSEQSACPPFRLGRWKVVPSLNELTRDGDSARIQGQQMALLVQLARAPGELVTRDSLLDQVWGQRPVTDDVLSRSIAALRAALGDDAKSPRYIETIPKKGYRLIMPPRFTGINRVKLSWALAAAVGGAFLIATYLMQDTGPTSPVMDPAALAENFTARPGVETYPTLSPGGEFLAYVENQSGTQTLLVADAASRRIRHTWPAAGLIRGLAFSPSGDRIALISVSDSMCNVKLLTLLTDQVTVLAPCWGDEPSGITWSRDSRFLIYSVPGEAGSAGLAALNLSTGDVTTITEPPDHKSDLFPAFSPDGQHLSFSRGDATTREIFSLAWQSGDPTLFTAQRPKRLTTDNQLAVRHAWPSNTQILFASDRAARQALWLHNLDNDATIFFGARGARQPSLSNAGDLAYQIAIFEANLWAIDLNRPESEPRMLVQSRRYDNHPVFSPDGTRLLFLSNRSGKSALWVSNPNGTEQTRVYESEDGRLTRPAWSFDGQWMLGVIYQEDSSSVLRLPRDGGAPEILDFLGNSVVQVVSMDNGHWLTVTETSAGSMLEWHSPAGTIKRFENLNPNHIVPGPDHTVLFTAQGQPGIQQLQLSSGKTRLVIDDLAAQNWNAWTANTKAIYFAQGSRLMKKSLPDGKTEAVSEFVPGAIGLTMAVNPQESQLLVTRTDHVEIDIMLARGLFQELDGG